MKQITPLADHLAPDTVNRLERAAEVRHDDGLVLMREGHTLGALYLFGHGAEMCLSAAYFRAAGFSSMMVIDRDARRQDMARARNLQTEEGTPLMNGDPHPIVGWARFLEWKRRASMPTEQHQRRLSDAIFQAKVVYKHWRPELRYKTMDAKPNQVAEVLKASAWFLDQRGRL